MDNLVKFSTEITSTVDTKPAKAMLSHRGSSEKSDSDIQNTLSVCPLSDPRWRIYEVLECLSPKDFNWGRLMNSKKLKDRLESSDSQSVVSENDKSDYRRIQFINNLRGSSLPRRIDSPWSLARRFKNSCFFSVWRSTSEISIRLMMEGKATGKSMNVKGKSAKCGKLSGFVPFMQIHKEEHKKLVNTLSRKTRVRIFYSDKKLRDDAVFFLQNVWNEIKEAGEETENLMADDYILRERRNTCHSQEEGLMPGPKKYGEEKNKFDNSEMGDKEVPHNISPSGRSFCVINPSAENCHGTKKSATQISPLEKMKISPKVHPARISSKINHNDTKKQTDRIIILIGDYAPDRYGISIPGHLFQESYITRQCIHRDADLRTGRPSEPGYMDWNFHSIRECNPKQPSVVLLQLSHEIAIDPRTLVMAYEESGTIMPVVSDIDPFLIGSRGINYNPLPKDQMDIMKWCIEEIGQILKTPSTKSWTKRWLEVSKKACSKKNFNLEPPHFGFGDETTNDILAKAAEMLQPTGAIRHGAECFNLAFPLELDPEYLVISSKFGELPWRSLSEEKLRELLHIMIDDGYAFPVNLKWVLYDEGWYGIWKHLLNSNHCVQAMDSWFPKESGLREMVEEIHTEYPNGFVKEHMINADDDIDPHLAQLELKRYKVLRRVRKKLRAVYLLQKLISK